MRYLQIVWQRVRIDHKSVVLAGNLDSAGGKVLDRMIGPSMTTIHLVRGRTHGQRHQLVADADAKHRHVGIDLMGFLVQKPIKRLNPRLKISLRRPFKVLAIAQV